jgi:hypothetical protein
MFIFQFYEALIGQGSRNKFIHFYGFFISFSHKKRHKNIIKYNLEIHQIPLLIFYLVFLFVKRKRGDIKIAF